MRTLPPGLLAESQKPQGGKWIWLYDIEVDRTTLAVPYFALCDYHKPIVWGGQTWYPAPIAHSDIRRDGDGNLPEVTVSVSNVSREVMGYLETGEGFSERPLIMRQVHEDWIGSASDKLAITLTIDRVEVSDAAVAFVCSESNLWQEAFPSEFFERDRCGRTYKGFGCHYRGPEATCDRRSVTCGARGDAEVALGYPRLHPRLFGGMPGLPVSIR